MKVRGRFLTVSLSIALLVAFALALSGCAGKTTVVSSDGKPLNTVTAAGDGKALAAPDTAEMTFGASASGTEAQKVLDDAAATSKAIVAAVKKAGVADDDIQTTGVNLYPQYNYDSGGATPKVAGYEGSVSVRVTVRDIAKLGDIIAAAGNAGSNNISGPAWTLDEDSAQVKAAIEDAIADARTRAETMAAAVGKSVGDVISINESGVSSPIVYGDMSLSAAEDNRMSSVPIEAGNLEVTANVTVVFSLE